jgi:anion-transporting  ArsA/GET3 family ATPase
VASRAGAPLLGVLGRLTGASVLREITAFFAAIGGMIDGLAARAAAVQELLHDPATTFVLVSSPKREAIEESIAFAAELRRAELSLAALVVNRIHTAPDVPADPHALEALLGPRLATLVRDSVTELTALADADGAALARLRGAFPDLEPLLIPELGGQIEDLAGLARIAGYLGRERI